MPPLPKLDPRTTMIQRPYLTVYSSFSVTVCIFGMLIPRAFNWYPYCPTKSHWKNWHVFPWNHHFLVTFPPNGALSRWTNPGSKILVPSPSTHGIICLCLVKFKKLHFMRLNCQFEFISFYVYDQLGLKTKNKDHFLARFNVMNLVAVFLYTYGTLFWKPSIP